MDGINENFYKKNKFFGQNSNAEKVKEFCILHSLSVKAFYTAVFGFTLKAFTYSNKDVFSTPCDSGNYMLLSMEIKNNNESVISFIENCQKQLSLKINEKVFSDVNSEFLFAYLEDERKHEKLISTARLYLYADNKKIIYDFEYDQSIYDLYVLKNFYYTMDNVIAEFLSKEKLQSVKLVTQQDDKNILNFYDTFYPVNERPAYRILQDSAEKYPENIALIAADRTLTYKELNEEANALGNILKNRGVKIETIVAVFARRNSYAYVMRQGVLKSGGAFLSIDPAYPDERIKFILKDSKAKFLVTEHDMFIEHKDLFDSIPDLIIIDVRKALKDGNRENLNINVPNEALAYVIYTSGSTGQPKGVMLTNKNLVNFVDDNEKNHEIQGYIKNAHVSLAIAALTFDFSIMEEFLPIANGLTAVLAAENDITNPIKISNLIKENNVDFIFSTPSYLSNMLNFNIFAEAVKRLNGIDLGGEVLTPTLCKKIFEINPDIYLMNGYGPTEATISCTMQVVDNPPDNITIGIPNANVNIATIDPEGRLQLPGSLGEMVIIGSGIGRGYINHHELTKNKFIKLLGKPAYKSGDLVRILESKQIEFYGRIDNQVKLRGLRIELNEIESVINSYSGIRSSKVIVVKGKTDFLAAYFTVNEKININILKKYLASELTAYMIPQVFIQLSEMPLTVNGKINTNLLPKVKNFQISQRVIQSPKTDLQRELCNIFKRVLALDEVGINENFFELGGTSLLASNVMMSAMAKDLPIIYQDIFDNPTIESLANLIEEKIKLKPSPMENQQKEENDDNFDKILVYNTLEYLDEISIKSLIKLNNVFLTGATGFLGIHILRELINNTDVKKIYCLIRNSAKRLKEIYAYYFEDMNEEIFDKKVIILEGDITDKESIKAALNYDFNILINCAACVKHFGELDFFKRINVDGVANLAELCIEKKARFIHISTMSVAGISYNSNVKILKENKLNIGQKVKFNGYVYTKYLAEKIVLKAIAEKNLDAKIIRLGNLMSRKKDGKFQINFTTNYLMNNVKAYAFLQCFPLQFLDETEELSPVDEAARAVLLLAGTERKFTVFHAYNSHSIKLKDIIIALRKTGFNIDISDEIEFNIKLKKVIADEKMHEFISPLLHYKIDNDENYSDNLFENIFTVKALYKLGFQWSLTDIDYIQKSIEQLKNLGFFERRTK